MEWIANLNRALRYVEEHLTDEALSVESIARIAACSTFYLQRLFYVLTDMSLSDYVRQRRLSAAGQELQTGGKVIDAALKYGYETPESFQKAFRRFHGITPSAAKKTRVQLRYLNPLQIKVSLTGGSVMDYSMENLGEQTVVGFSRKFHYDTSFQQIPLFWSEYFSTGIHERGPCGAMVMGICFDEDDGPEFTYMIGAFCEPDVAVPEGFEKRMIPAHTWAKFRCVGPMPEAIQKLNRRIFTEWLPNNAEYDIAEGINIECYAEGDMQSPEYESEIWLPVRRKG